MALFQFYQNASPANPTLVLRGIAILVVVCSHYHMSFFKTDGIAEGYGNAAVALFFIVSGYGNARSLRKRQERGKISISRYYADRFLRLYPIYWLGLVTIWIISHSVPDLWAWLGLRAPYWFVHAIMQCAFIAPIVYLFICNMSPKWSVFWIICAVAVLNMGTVFLPQAALQIVASNIFTYRHIVFGHLGLFALGMALALLLDSQPRVGCDAPRWLSPTGLGVLALVVYLLALVFLGADRGGRSGIVCGLGLFLASLAVAALVLSGRIQLPFPRLLALLGRNSYAIYLFEPVYFWLLLVAGVRPATWTGFLVYLVAFPAFLLLCQTMESRTGLLARTVGARLR